MDDKAVTASERTLLSFRLDKEVWKELDAIRKARRWTWQVLLEEIVSAFLISQKKRSSEGGK